MKPVLQISQHVRAGGAQLFSEFVATFGLLSVIWGCVRLRSEAVPIAVGLYITGAYWFTASTSFANPAVTLARSLRIRLPEFARSMFRALSPRSWSARSAATALVSLAGAVAASSARSRCFSQPTASINKERANLKERVLILCTGNSARSQMAEGLLRHDAGERFEVESAGTKPGHVGRKRLPS